MHKLKMRGQSRFYMDYKFTETFKVFIIPKNTMFFALMWARIA